MNACMRTFVLWGLWVSAAMYRAGGETEMLLKQPTAGVPWIWHATKTAHKGAGWNLASKLNAYSVCDITTDAQPTNWLRTNFINVKDAKMLNVKLTYSLFGCPPMLKPFCKHSFSLYVLHAETSSLGTDLNPLKKTVTYRKVDTIKPKDLPDPGKRKSYAYHGKIVTKERGVYLAFLDQGSCVSITSVILSYNYCSEIESILVRFSKTASPVNDSYLVEQTGNCTDVNSINKGKLSGVCLSSGEWNVTDGVKCLCKAGYELVNGSEGNAQECRECQNGYYKSIVDNTKCLQCPKNSASNTGRTGCFCNDGFYKRTELAPCKEMLLKQPTAGVPWIWHATKTAHKGAGWNLASKLNAYSVCDITIDAQPTNWLRTNFINVKDAKMLNVKLTYNLLGCPSILKPFCKHNFSLYVLHAETASLGTDLNPLNKTVTYRKVDTIKPKDLPDPGKRKSYAYHGKIVTKERGVYLAFLDQGSCVSITSVILSYNYCK